MKRLILRGEPLEELNEYIEASNVGPLIFDYLGITEAVDAWIIAQDKWEKGREERRISECNEIWLEGDMGDDDPF
jgi:hypothetical protein